MVVHAYNPNSPPLQERLNQEGAWVPGQPGQDTVFKKDKRNQRALK
jgi:hypothetical protein